MLNSLSKIFQKSSKDIDDNSSNPDLELLCGLMLEAAQIDGKIDQNEVDSISRLLVESFDEEPSEVEQILQKSLDNLSDVKSLHFFTSKINKKFDEEKKILLIQTLWEIILADGKIHDFESSLIRRLAGLLYISDMVCGNAKKIALTKIDNQKA